MSVVAIIPARGGSKRIPGKNIRAFAGKPMLAWTLEAARNSALFDRVLVSTEDEQIAETARHYGAETPFARPAALANDHATTLEVMRHAVQWLVDAEEPLELACCLYAAAPFIHPEDLRNTKTALVESGKRFCFPVAPYAHPVQRALRLGEQGEVEAVHPEFRQTRTQDLEERFHDAGQFYWGTVEAWLHGTELFSPDSVGRVIPAYRVQDIDTPADWERAERIFPGIMQ